MPLSKEFDQRIADLAAEKQAEYYAKYCELGTLSAVADALNAHKSTVGKSLKSLEKKAVDKGYMPACNADGSAGVGRIVKKVTTHVKGGAIEQEWIRTDKKAEDVLDQVRQAVDILSSEIKGCSDIPAFDGMCNDDLLSVYPLFDKHVGMMSWGKETGEDYDLAIAEKTELSVFKWLMASQPNSKHAVAVFGGDFYQCDDDNQVTPAHRNKVCVDGRSYKVFGTGVKIGKQIVDMLASKHENVTVMVLPGNHDPVLSMALQFVLAAYYADSDRISVIEEPGRFGYMEWGVELLAFQHGDKMKQEKMYEVVTTDQREAWGRVKHCTIFTGHFHRERNIDIGMCSLESLRSTIPNEAYSQEAGYRSPRSAYAITYHRDGGEIGRTKRNIF